MGHHYRTFLTVAKSKDRNDDTAKCDGFTWQLSLSEWSGFIIFF